MLNLEHLELRAGAFSLSADFAVPIGTSTAILGPSGGGKSTLLAAIAGFVVPASGTIRWDDQDITGLPPASRPVSILFQDNNLFPHLTVAQNVGLALRPGLRLSNDEAREVGQSLERVGLGAMGRRKPGSLSGGQQSRAALARVLLRRRPLLLLDEPFSALGPALKAEMLDLVAEIAQVSGTTVLMVTHDPADARRLAGHTVVVTGGRAHAPAPTAAVLDDPSPELRAYLGS